MTMKREAIDTDGAPRAIGTYSQAVRRNTTVYLSGQIPLHPETMALVEGGAEAQIRQVFDNLRAVARAAGGDLSHLVKLTVYLTDLEDFAVVNRVMGTVYNSKLVEATP